MEEVRERNREEEVEQKVTNYVIDACALIAYLRGEEGGDKLRALLKEPGKKFFLHSVNLGEVYYDSLRFSNKEYADKLLEDVKKLPIHIVWNLDAEFIKLLGKYKTSFKTSYADTFVLSLAEREEATVITTDYHEFSVVESSCNLTFLWLRNIPA